MKRFLVLALLLSSLPAASLAVSPTVEVANGNWSYLPLMKQHSTDHLSNIAISRIHEIAADKKCDVLSTRRGVLDFAMTFAAHFNPDGSLNRIVMPKLNCPEAESILGGILLKMVERGDYRPDGSNQDGWYRGELTFTIS